jgi:hypothetical protein
MQSITIKRSTKYTNQTIHWKSKKRDSPIYNLKKNYKYGIDKHNGFYKNRIEKFQDSVMDNLPQWIVGTIITGIITGILVILGINQ